MKPELPARRCAFLTLDDATDFVIDDHLAEAPMADLGWQVQKVPWRRRDIDWNGFDLVVIRSPWDYQDAPALFLDQLRRIDQSRAQLQNSLSTVQWNLNKRYLRQLADSGVPTIPTLWHDRLTPSLWPQLFDALDSDRIVLKPLIGANADGVLPCDRQQLTEALRWYREAPFMAQPFVTSVTAEGEYSLFYFNGQYSHAILKTPQSGDFRVQEEHGGAITSVAADDALVQIAGTLLDRFDSPPLYLRADLVRAPAPPGWWLMELELIEPALYLRMDDDAPLRFARACDARWRQSVDSPR